MVSRQPPLSLYAAVRKMSTFAGQVDRHRGVVVKSTVAATEQEKSTEFGPKLARSLIKWSADEQVHLVWFRIARQHAHWISELAKNNFLFHRTSPDGNELWMYKRLRGESTSTVDSPHTYTGAGGLVIRDDHLLVVKEHSIPFWKLPGGYVNPGENIGEAAVREVFEETGIRAEFVSLVAFRHVLSGSFDCADMYFVTNLRPLTFDIVIDKEISEAKWMKCEDFITSPDVGEHSRFFVKTFLENSKNGITMKANKAIHQFTNKEFISYAASYSGPTSSGADDV
ncbi:nucleoside diphosphate-linked moiety X motif 6 [Rhopalosiphum padi]|uniref:nucleoside diphosphate-linked moiety X motif 6 n=1 Tax=Rhopalosiphum padi TaxID=40932 RepID=UPI00298E3BD1|nr:nucleoside diphosphate-linked moiety X motif 6 [Rhopalosiphum padi]